MPRTKSALAGLAVALAVCCLLILLPCARKELDGEGWVRSAYTLRSIGQAFRTYYEVNGRLPPAVVRDKGGRPLYSWRVLLLPYLEEDSLSKQFKRDEAWDGPHNKKLLGQTPRCYQPLGGGNDPPGLTRYQVFVGPGTAFERDGLTWADFPGGPSGTMLVAEGGVPVPWSKPAELAYDPGRPLPALGGAFSRPVHFLCYELWREPGFTACFADGSARFIPATADEQALRGLITRGGSAGAAGK